MTAEQLEKAFRVVFLLLGGAPIKKMKTRQLIWKMKLAPWQLLQKSTDELIHVLLQQLVPLSSQKTGKGSRDPRAVLPLNSICLILCFQVTLLPDPELLTI